MSADREAAIREEPRYADPYTRMAWLRAELAAAREDLKAAFESERREAKAAEAAREREQTLREKARAAKSIAAAPDYDEEAIRDALWAVVDAALDATGGQQ